VAPQSGTQWKVDTSEGLDAIAFLGALSGAAFYVEQYREETPAFSARLSSDVLANLADLRMSAESNDVGLLWPWLALAFSGGPTGTIDDVIRTTHELEETLRPPFRASEHWEESSWAWLESIALRLRTVLEAMRDADFRGFREQLIGDRLERRAQELHGQLADLDVVTLQRKLSGKTLDPTVEIVLLYFCLPHGVRILGQRFIQSADFDLMTTVRVAAHELLHPPMDMNGPVAAAVLETLAGYELMSRVVSDHNPSFGYTTLDGYLNEDVCQALDQLIDEELSVARNPADRWHGSDDGIHVLAAGLYGMLRADGWVRRGGSIEAWLGEANDAGRLNADALHPVAARVLERPLDRLWPLENEPPRR